MMTGGGESRQESQRTRTKSLEHPGILGASSSWWTISPPAAALASAEARSSARTAAAAIPLAGKGKEMDASLGAAPQLVEVVNFWWPGLG